MNDVQAVDISVTRQWMRIIVWRLAESHGFFSHGLENARALLNDPIMIAKELLTTLSQFPNTAIEAHGPGLETKVFEIACSVADAIALGATGSTQPDQTSQKMARDVLFQLQKLLSKNKKLNAMLSNRIAKIQQRADFGQSSVSAPHASSDTNLMDLEIERQLLAHGFDFTDPMRPGQSPETESLSSDRAGRSPLENPLPFQQQSKFSPGVAMLDDFLQPSMQDGSSQHLHGIHHESGQSQIPSEAFRGDFDQGLSDMDFDFNTLPTDSTTPFGAFSDPHWPGYSPSHQSPHHDQFGGSIQGSSWRSRNQQ